MALTICLHKLIFETIIRTKVKLNVKSWVKHFNYWSNFLTEKGRKLLKDFQKWVNFENLSNFLQQLKPIQIISGDMSCWVELYLDMVYLLFNIIEFQRTGNWNGFLETIRKFLPFCLALKRHNYARNLPYYFISMLNFQNSHPNIYQYLKNGGFIASISGLPFSKIPECDQIIEIIINRSSKSTGGLSGKTENIESSGKWMQINHIMAALREHLESVIRKSIGSKNTDCAMKRFLSDKNDVLTNIEGMGS